MLMRRLFATTQSKKAKASIRDAKDMPTMQLHYLLDKARVKVSLPSQGTCWFFINPGTTMASFADRVKQEDPQIQSAEVLSESKKKKSF